MKNHLSILIYVVLTGFGCWGQTAATSKNQKIIDAMIKYGPAISSTYEKAVCTELVIQILEKFTPLSKTDKNRIRIITDENIHALLQHNSSIPKGIYHALTATGTGIAIDNQALVQPGDFVQFWTDTWGHCGLVKSINLSNKTMELYSSFPSTNGYGIQVFKISQYCYFVRLK
jgi:polyhydroxyalkanoate synthesis regulator phasin